ncbi:kinetochore-associated Ndc80 complex subunit spc25 [Imshaugia aleurites]|uniref:Kinetochore protein SPC25 n=1 Tax=Imshaugia aleurites TaxID=172621 RepID=A0A8H3I2Z1_9LECA|nr:kinetochore-associated Ndc80 complex subunit spc25 [Imshaugia aleurites]
MSTLFEPSLSTSAMRAPFSTADAPSMADSLPAITFGFDDLRERMARFTDRFDDFIAKGRKQVLEEHNQFCINVAQLQEDQRMKQKDIEILAQKSSHHAAAVSAQEAETAEMQLAIAAITQQRDSHAQHRDRLRSEIASLNKQIAARRSAQQVHAKEMEAQSRLNVPELDFWETYLGLRIDGAGQVDRLKFVFSNLDERDWEKEAWFELDTERREYRVVGCRPKVEEGEVEACVDRLNESRDLGAFLRGMREIFVKGMK